MANNPRWDHVRSQANQARAAAAGRQQAAQARQALEVLQNQRQHDGSHVYRWIQALQHRIDNPEAALGDLAQSMSPPLSKHAYAAVLRRALRAGGITATKSKD